MRTRTLLVALLATAPAAASSAAGSGPAHEPPARVEVLEGRASVALPSSVLRLESGAPLQQFSGPIHLELAPASRARVGWSGEGSLLLEGRTVVEWKAPEERGDLMRWTFVEVDRAGLEVRRGRVHLELPGGWRGLLQPGAYALEGRAGGPVEFRHDAGLPVTFWPPAGSREALPPYTVLAGSAVRLVAEAPRPLTLPGSSSAVQEPHAKLGFEARPVAAHFPAWKGFAWPWSRPREARSPAPVEEAQAAPPRRSSRPAEVSLEGRGPLGERIAPTGRRADPEGDATGPVGERREPAAPAEERPALIELPPPFWNFAPVRNEGVLVLTPYGPRWVDVAEVLSRLRRPAPAR